MSSCEMEISSLRPGLEQWKIKGRCTTSDPLKRIQGGRGLLKAFELSDGTEAIRVTAFDDIASRLSARIRKGDWYAVSNCTIKPASRYSPTTRLEILVNNANLVSIVGPEANLSIGRSFATEQPDIQPAPRPSRFTQISELHQLSTGTLVNVLGRVSEIEELQTTPRVKRRITITDESGSSIKTTLWREQATSLLSDADRGRMLPLLFKNAKVWRASGGAAVLSVEHSTQVERDPSSVNGYSGSLLDNTRSPVVPSPRPTPYSMRHTVFISHAGVDKETIALPLREKLGRQNVQCFVDREDLRPGDRAGEVMSAAMQTAMIGVFILSPEFVARKWTFRELRCFMDRQMEASNQRQVPPVIIPVFHSWTIEQCKDPQFFSLSDVFRREGFFDRDRQEEAPTHVVHNYLRDLTNFTGIEFGNVANRRRWRLLGNGARDYRALIKSIAVAVMENLNRLAQM